jgi:hypothetical protein
VRAHFGCRLEGKLHFIEGAPEIGYGNRSYHGPAFVADDIGLLSANNAVEKKDLSVWLSAAEAHGIDPL